MAEGYRGLRASRGGGGRKNVAAIPREDIIDFLNNRNTLSAAYAKTHATAADLVPAAPADRTVVVVATVTEVYATGTGTQPTLKVGEESDTAKFFPTSTFVNAAAGASFAVVGTLTGGKKLQVTGTAAVGNATGAAVVTALVLPKV